MNHAGHVVGGERHQAQNGRIASADPRRIEPVARGRQDHQAMMFETGDNAIQQLARGRIEPMQIFDDEAERLLSGQQCNLAHQHREQPLAQHHRWN
ncbi:MAG TPA: hypothetical protein VK955_13875, partial [Xanthobacteraceae bacterium]|nr:hypothetical protein [Xanthobacteraceae bacterium]